MPGQRQSGRNGDKQCLLVTEAWAKVSVTKMRPGQKVTATQGDQHEAGPRVPSRGRISDQGSETRPESSYPREQLVSSKTHQVLSMGGSVGMSRHRTRLWSGRPHIHPHEHWQACHPRLLRPSALTQGTSCSRKFILKQLNVGERRHQDGDTGHCRLHCPQELMAARGQDTVRAAQ